MSKQITSQKMEMTCDACGISKEWELVGADDNASILAEMQEWYVVGRKVVDLRSGQLTQMTADACTLACVPAAAIKLALPRQSDEPADNIDLASLRNDFSTN